jgi:hypothetical protein
MEFEQLAMGTEGLSDAFYLEFFISGLNESIRAYVNMQYPTTWLHTCQLAMEVESIL